MRMSQINKGYQRASHCCSKFDNEGNPISGKGKSGATSHSPINTGS